MKIYLNPDYKDHRKLEKAILEEFPEISVKAAKYKGGKKKATFVYKETCYKFENREDLLLTLKELLEYTDRRERLEGASASKKDGKEGDRKGKGANDDSRDGKDKRKDSNDKGKSKDKDKDKGRKSKEDRKKDGREEIKLEAVTPHGKDVLIVHPEDNDDHVPTLKEILKTKDYEQIDEAFYGETAFEDREQDEDQEDQAGSYDASLPESVEKEDHEVMADTFDEAENQKALTYEVEDVEDIRHSDIMEEMGFIETEEDGTGDSGQMSYEESVPVSEGKDDVEVMEEAFENLDKSKRAPAQEVTADEDRTEGKVQPDDLMRELGYVETEESGNVAEPDEKTPGQDKGRERSEKAKSVEDRSGRPATGRQQPNEIVLQVPVEKYNLNDLNIKIKFGHFDEPSSTYETKKK